MKLKKNSIFFIYIFFFFYASLVIGFLFNEDSAGGAIKDYLFHLVVRDFFLNDTLFALKNYLAVEAIHSPVFIIFLKYILLFNETTGRFFFLNICILIPLIFFISMKKKEKKNFYLIFYLSCFFFISPYFRSTAIWPGDENLALLFFVSSIYFYITFLNSKNENNKIKYMLFNIVLLAAAAYFRPNYSFFSIFFFYEFIFKNFKINYFVIYLLTSFFLAFPAFYYVFILEVNFFYASMENFNLINSLALTYSILLFFLIPFILSNKKNFYNFKFNYINLFFTIIFSIIVFIFFNYQAPTGGGILFMLQNLFFKGNLVFTFIFAISFYVVNEILEINKIKNLIILLILLFLELDSNIYMETLDPLFLICVFLLFDVKIINNFFNNEGFKKINLLFIYLFLFYLAKVSSLYVL